jgi:hypothetical protein
MIATPMPAYLHVLHHAAKEPIVGLGHDRGADLSSLPYQSATLYQLLQGLEKKVTTAFPISADFRRVLFTSLSVGFRQPIP